MSLVEELADEVKTAAMARVLVAEKWSSTVALSVFLVCLSAIVIAVLVTR